MEEKRILKVKKAGGVKNPRYDIDLAPFVEGLHDVHNRYSAYWREIYEFLGTAPEDCYVASKEYSLSRDSEIFIIIDTLLEGYTMHKVCDDDYDPGPMRYKRIEIAPNEYVEVPGYGVRFVEKDDIPMLIKTIYRGQVMDIEIVAADKEVAQKFLEQIDNKARESTFLKGQIIRPSGTFVHLDREYLWEDVVLEDKIKEEIRRNTEKLFSYSEFYKVNNLPSKRGIIFKGPPGTGKTQCVRVLSCWCRKKGITVVLVTAKDITDGASGRNVSNIYTLAKELSPTLVILEDMDLYAKHREQESSSALGELLNTIDGVESGENIVTVVTTNRVDVIDKALKDRPGRFDRHFYFGPPESKDLCRKMYTLFGEEMIKDVKLDPILKATPKHFTGAHIREVVSYASLLAIEEGNVKKDKRIFLTRELLHRSIKAVEGIDIERTIGFGIQDERREEDDDIETYL